MSRFDFEVEEQLQRYYCRALARQLDDRFYDEIMWYVVQRDRDREKCDNNYHFLKGFMYRLKGDYDKAVQEYQIVLSHSPNSRATRREIVASYLGMEEFDVCRQYAEANYRQDPSNKYYLQDYFETLIQSENIFNNIDNKAEGMVSERLNDNIKNIEKLMEQLEDIYALDDSKDSFYYEIKAKYCAFVDNNYEEAIRYLDKGQLVVRNSTYIIVTKFDICEKMNDIKGMAKALEEMKPLVAGNVRTDLAYSGKTCHAELYFGTYSGRFLQNQGRRGEKSHAV